MSSGYFVFRFATVNFTKWAVAARDLVNFTTQFSFLPLQALCHPEKRHPAFALATSVTLAPGV